MTLVKLLGAVDGNIFIKNHLKGTFRFIGILDQEFLFIEKNLHYMKKGSRYNLSSISSKTLAVSPAKDVLVDM